jgi:hypothetical protein
MDWEMEVSINTGLQGELNKVIYHSHTILHEIVKSSTPGNIKVNKANTFLNEKSDELYEEIQTFKSIANSFLFCDDILAFYIGDSIKYVNNLSLSHF